MQTVVETVPYLADARRLFTDDERAAIVDAVSSIPVRATSSQEPVAYESCGLPRAGAASVVAPA
jgi:hypothetical protein